MLSRLKDILKGKATLSTKRSSKWPSVRKAFLLENPECAACGSREKLEIHHVKPFHLYPDLELDPRNLITLCEARKGMNCHLAFGHLLNWKRENPNVRLDAAAWRRKLGDVA